MIKSLLLSLGVASGLTIAGSVGSISGIATPSYSDAEKSYLTELEQQLVTHNLTTTLLVYESIKPRNLLEYGKRACDYYKTGGTSEELSKLQIEQHALYKKSDIISLSLAQLMILANEAAESKLCPQPVREVNEAW